MSFVIHIDNQGHKMSLPIRNEQDLDNLFDMYPGAALASADASGMRQVAHEIASYLSAGYADAWVEEVPDSSDGSNMKKSAVIAGAALLMSVSSLGADSHDVGRFLAAISQLESSGGKNYDHSLVKHGVSAGDRAMGRWGLMKHTVDEVLSRIRKSRGFLPKILQPIENAERDAIDTYLKSNPLAEEQIAGTLARIVLKKADTLSEAAYMWLNGHNMSHEDLAERDVEGNQYVVKFNKAYESGSTFLGKTITPEEGKVSLKRKLARLKQREPMGVMPFHPPNRTDDLSHVVRSDSGEKVPGPRGEAALTRIATEARRRKKGGDAQ